MPIRRAVQLRRGPHPLDRRVCGGRSRCCGPSRWSSPTRRSSTACWPRTRSASCSGYGPCRGGQWSTSVPVRPEFAAAFAARGARYLAVDADPDGVPPPRGPPAGCRRRGRRREPAAGRPARSTSRSAQCARARAPPGGLRDELVRVDPPRRPGGGRATPTGSRPGAGTRPRRSTIWAVAGPAVSTRAGTGRPRRTVWARTCSGSRWPTACAGPDASPRPRCCGPAALLPGLGGRVVRVPGLREVATWNLLLVLRRL